jgi:hypothetical protein
MESLDLIRGTLLSPMTLSFALGATATLLRSDLKFPEPVYAALSIYLLLAIGMKGGAAIGSVPMLTVAIPALAAILLAATIPIWTYHALRHVGGFAATDAAALAAHYGAVSTVTFIAALGYVQSLSIPVEGFMPAMLAMMDVPAIAVALLLARQGKSSGAWKVALREVMVGRSVMLLVGGLMIGLLAGPQGYKSVAPFFAEPFQGALCLFLLDLGMVAAQRLRDARKVGPFLIAFAITAPIVNGAIGVLAGRAAGLSMGGAAVLGTLAASSSYIAAPAAVRLALPAANPGYYLTASLAITFPFNLIVGLPLYVGMARWLYG